MEGAKKYLTDIDSVVVSSPEFGVKTLHKLWSGRNKKKSSRSKNSV